MFVIQVFCLVMWLHLSVTLEVKPMQLANSVVRFEGDKICVPQSYECLRARIWYGQPLRQLSEQLETVLKEMGKYGAPMEPKKYMEKRICRDSEKVNSFCPLSKVTPTSGVVTIYRHAVLEAAEEIEDEINNILTVTSMLPSKYISPIQTMTEEQVETQCPWTLPANTDSRNVTYTMPPPRPNYQLQLEDAYQINLDFLADYMTGINNEFRFPEYSGTTTSTVASNPLTTTTVAADRATFTSQIAKLATLMEDTKNHLRMILSDLRGVQSGKFPSYLFPYRTWMTNWIGQTNELAPIQKENFQFSQNAIEKFPLTMIKRKASCTPYEDIDSIPDACYMDIVTLIPVAETTNKYDEIMLTPHPVPAKPEDPENKTWHIVNLPEVLVLRNNEDFYTASDDLKCLPKQPQFECSLCTSHVALQPIEDQCLKLVLKDLITAPPCELVSTANTESLQVVQSPNDGTVSAGQESKIIITNPEGTTVIESCTDGDSSRTLPPASTLIVKPGCTIKFLNAPKVKEILPNFKVSTVPHVTQGPVQTTTKMAKLDQVKNHFDEFGYIYIISTISVAGLITITCTIRLTCKKCKPRLRIIQYPKFHLRPAPGRPVIAEEIPEMAPLEPRYPGIYPSGRLLPAI